MAPQKKHDPIEAAKITSKMSVITPPPPPPSSPSVPEVAAAAAAPAAFIAASDARYRVKNTTTISLYGQIVVLPVDTVISASGYGPDGMQRIIDSNVPLEKLE